MKKERQKEASYKSIAFERNDLNSMVNAIQTIERLRQVKADETLYIYCLNHNIVSTDRKIENPGRHIFLGKYKLINFVSEGSHKHIANTFMRIIAENEST
ncbi:MAG: hypothetical protein Q7S59_10340 [Sulfurimonas sp.]|nr:hypothetical protein [Sulfurimonas sp.]